MVSTRNNVLNSVKGVHVEINFSRENIILNENEMNVKLNSVLN